MTGLAGENPDLYVSAGGTAHSDGACDEGAACWSSAQVGDDMLEIPGAAAEACREPCQWSLLVVAHGQGVSLTLLATVQGSPEESALTTLQEGVALRARAPSGQYTFFRFDVARADTSAKVALTVFSGDPDLYCSFEVSRPTQANHSYASTGSGDEVVRISHLDPRMRPFCLSLPCTLYIGVLGYTNATFSVLASLRDDRVLRLLDGQAQSDVLEAGSWRYFRYSLANGSEGFRVSAQPSYGDPDIYLTNTGDTPSETTYGWYGHRHPTLQPPPPPPPHSPPH